MKLNENRSSARKPGPWLSGLAIWLAIAAACQAQSSVQDAEPLPSIVSRQGASISLPTDASRSETVSQLEKPLPLRPRSETTPTVSRAGKSSTKNALTTVLGSLTIVLVAFFAFVWVSRKAAPRSQAPLPNEVLESLGKAPLAGRQHLQLVRLGKKLVLLGVSPTGAQPLAEITDPLEVDRLAGLCQQHRPGSITESFRHVLTQSQAAPETSRGTPAINNWDGERLHA